jgi:hypothetical protein
MSNERRVAERRYYSSLITHSGQAHLNFNDNDDLQVKMALQHQRTPSNGVNGVKEHKIIEIGRSRQSIVEMLRLINQRIYGLLDALALITHYSSLPNSRPALLNSRIHSIRRF